MNYAIDKTVALPCSIHMPKHIEDAGADIQWGHDFDVTPGGISKINTGICLDLPKGWVGLIFPRSSNSTLSLANKVGVIDSTYTGPIILKVVSDSFVSVYEEEKHFQLVIIPHLIHNLNKVDSLDKDTTRGSGGFGSTN